jgi:class 3 adenylate cyclase
MVDFSTLSMTEIIRLQNLLQQELTRRFERYVALGFSDIAGSTPYFERFGDAAGRRLQQLHIDLLNECLPPSQGRIVDTAGDGAFIAFSDAEAAIASLIEFHKRISRENATRSREHQLQVRIGAHWGPVLTDGVAVSGDSVNLCARVAASSEVGEIRVTREMFKELPTRHRLSCRPLGMVELKGILRPTELLALEWRDHAVYPTRVRIEETGEEMPLPQQDVIGFGRLREHEGAMANDIALALPDPLHTQQISRWHFELRRLPDGFRLRALSSAVTEVDGVPVAKGQEAPIKPGSRARIARVMTLVFASPPRPSLTDGSLDTRLTSEPNADATPR